MNQPFQAYLALFGRIFLTAIFVMSGLHKIADPQGSMQYMAAMGMPMTGFFLVGAIVLELAGSVLLLLGYWTRIGAVLLIVFMIPATLIFHTNFSDQIQLIMFMKNLAMTGGLLMVLAFGPGGFSLSARRASPHA